jgi:hypothetical protein
LLAIHKNKAYGKKGFYAESYRPLY